MGFCFVVLLSLITLSCAISIKEDFKINSQYEGVIRLDEEGRSVSLFSFARSSGVTILVTSNEEDKIKFNILLRESGTVIDFDNNETIYLYHHLEESGKHYPVSYELVITSGDPSEKFSKRFLDYKVINYSMF